MSEQSKSVADRAMALHEAKSPHQLAVELVCMQDQRDQLAAQLEDATRQCGVMAALLRECIEDEEPGMHFGSDLLDRVNAALAGKLPEQDDFLRNKRTDDFPQNISLTGKLPERQDTEWTDATHVPTEQDYRELQAQHDQLQSRHKAAIDVVRDLVELPYSTGGVMERLEVRERARDLLAGQVPDPAVPEGWQLVPVEPAFAMLAADGCKEHHEGQECIHHKNRRRIWAAMLAAAPKPEGTA